MNPLLAKYLHAKALLAEGKAAEALAVVQRLSTKHPNDPGLASLSAVILLRLGRFDQAEFYARRAVALEPGQAPLLVNLATILVAQRKSREAMEAARQAVEANPGDPAANVAYANALLDTHDAPAAAEVLRAALERTQDVNVYVSYAGALLAIGKIGEVVALLRRIIPKYPDEPNLAAALPLAMTYLYGVDPDDLAAAHRAYGSLMRRLKPAVTFPHANPRDPDRRLRVAIVSPDLRTHSVSFFIEPFFEHHDRSAFELVAYSRTRDPDHVSERLKAHAARWVDIANLTDLQIAQRLHADKVDVAIELAGHTMGNSLPAFALRPVPVQVTYCGYPDTTGLPEIDYRIVDSFTDPCTPEVDRRAAEHLWRLDPCFLCYRPLPDAPAPARDPAYPGPVFGSFNAARKINPGLIALWARLLNAVPGSRLILKSFDFAAKGAIDRISADFSANGIAHDRLTFMTATPSLADHLALYSRMDVALDAFPYHGTTTTCEALWMGVPVVTLAGNTHAGRVGISLLSNAGCPELIAHSEDEYVRCAANLIADPTRLAAYRTTLRSRLAASPICDAPGFAARFGQALRAMWGAWCTKTDASATKS
ncbi:MAG: hypothetical protein HBSAPP03_13970 [Phycisphaerae bacterium]|nr:MAG: hypothetical protein HBSAPP03_13970 [Phycisphaerae bacterium]